MRIVENIEPSELYRQNVFRIVEDEKTWSATIALKLPERQNGDNKSASKNQRDTLESFFWDSDILPPESGWQQASQLMSIRGLSWAVSETLEEGFKADNRIVLAPFIATYISRDPYLCCVARGYSLGTWSNRTNPGENWFLSLISSPFYRELIEFSFLARDDIGDALHRMDII